MENLPHSPGDTFQPSNNESVLPTSLDTQVPQKKKNKKLLVVLVILLLGIIVGLLVWKVLIPNLQYRDATNVANQFINAIKANDAQAAYSQTTSNYQSKVGQAQVQQSLHSEVFKNVDKSKIKLVSKESVSSDPQIIEFKYAFSVDGKTYFIKLSLVENNGTWKVDDEVLSADTDGFQRDGTAN